MKALLRYYQGYTQPNTRAAPHTLPPTPQFENPVFFSFFSPSTKGARASDGSTLSMSSNRCMRVTRQAGGSQREEEEEDSFGILISPENQRLRRCPLPATRREKQYS